MRSKPTVEQATEDRTNGFVAGFGLKLVVYDLTDLFTTVSPLVAQDGAPANYASDLPNNVWDVLIDQVPVDVGGTTYDKTYVYMAIGLNGIEVLYLDPEDVPLTKTLTTTHLQRRT